MKRLQIFFLVLFVLVLNCNKGTEHIDSLPKDDFKQYLTVLGIAQDAGFPQINCEKPCCALVYSGQESKKMVSSLGLVDLDTKQKWLFDATPDIAEQLQYLKTNDLDNGKVIDGVFLTHAHIGHYTGLMYFGFEALGSANIPVYAMPRMSSYLKSNGPWSQLVTYDNIEIRGLEAGKVLSLNSSLKVTPIHVPHRDEYSETVGYKIEGDHKTALFIPDIDKWSKWDRDIVEAVKQVDYAFLDASFFRDGELQRDMSKIPHPFTTETTTLFENETVLTKQKIYFIHLNHTNPAIRERHALKDSLQDLGFNFAKQGDRFEL